MLKLLQPEFSSYTNEVRAQNPFTFLQRHSTDITYHISFQSPLRAPKFQNVTLLAFLLDINQLSASQRWEDFTWVCSRIHVHMRECVNVRICVCVHMSRQQDQGWESLKILTRLLYLSCWQFLSGSLVQNVPCSKKINLGSVFDIYYTFIKHNDRFCHVWTQMNTTSLVLLEWWPFI